MNILIAGDLVINKNYEVSKKIDKSIIDLYNQSNFNVVNLEAPVTNNERKILKTGPHLKSDEESTLNALKTMKVNIVTLANNHIKDYGEKGVLDTIDFCKRNEIKAIGAGENITDASKTMVLNTLEGNIAIINIAENEWSSADESTAGANGMNIIKDTKKIQQAKKENDFVFVIIHGGHEYYNLPSPRMQEQYRFYAEQGADLVVGHHTHCISGYEVYNGTPIYYSLGNFLFTKNSQKEDWYTGLILEVKVNNGTLEAELHPVRQTKEGFRLSLLKNVEKKEVLRRVEGYSDIIKSEEDLIKEWHLFVISKQKTYLNYWSPKVFIKNKYVTGVLNRLNVKLINTRGLTYFLNLMRCEAHYDLSKAIISEYLDK